MAHQNEVVGLAASSQGEELFLAAADGVVVEGPGGHKIRRSDSWGRALRNNWRLYTFVVVPVLFLLVFRYVPMIGNVIAFRRFNPGGALLGDEWVGLHYFQMAFKNKIFWDVFWNTVTLGGLWLVIGFPLPIILALLLNELRSSKAKRTVQTITYLPHFLSIVIVAGIVLQLVDVDGTVNQVLGFFGVEPITFMQEARFFPWIYVISEAWQTVGWGTILYPRRSPRSTTSSTRRPGSTAPTAGSRPGTSRCRASAPRSWCCSRSTSAASSPSASRR